MLVEGVKYQINWRAFKPGTSIFLPCLDVAAAKAQVIAVTKRLGVNILVKVEIRDGIRGLRIWRERI